MDNIQRSRILVIDDDVAGGDALCDLLREEGYEVLGSRTPFKALGKFEEFSPHLVITDLKLPGIDGIELMRKIHERDHACPVIVVTGFAKIETAVDAMRAGAVDYLTKPINFDELEIVVVRALETQRLRAETSELRSQLGKRRGFDKIIGSSPRLQQIFEQVEQVAESNATVVIGGESGTGKELIAAAIHNKSRRAKGPFIKVHCAALAETLLESELFGHERGAFTGAIARRDGRFFAAHGGTLFLDEIGDISPSIQVKLLRVLQEREFERVGSSEPIKVDVRIVAATNRNLRGEVDAGNFREDLFYRLNVVSLEMPALRDRRSDIPLLATHFLEVFAKENEKEIESFSDSALSLLKKHYWPGNVRELENAIERAVVMSRNSTIDAEDLPDTVRSTPETASGAPPMPGASLSEVEKYLILKTIEHTGGSTSKAANMLGISTRKVQYRLQEYGTAYDTQTQTPA